jgi:hypothetical protein
MSLKIYPTLPGLTFPVLKSADFDTLIPASPNRYESRLPQTVNPQWSFQLVYDFLRDNPGGTFTAGEMRTLWDFFLYHGGQAKSFLFLDVDDSYVGPAMVSGAPNAPLAQLQLVNDGAGNFYSPLQRTFGGLFYEDVTDLNTDTGAGGSALAVYANGVLAASGTGAGQYQLLGPGLAVSGNSFMGMYLKWGAGTPPSAPITAQFNFYFRVRFGSDSQDMEKFADKFWTIGGSESQKGSGQIRLLQARPVSI